jgi:hypothetical protein
MMREMVTRGPTIVGTTGLAAPMSMLTICAPDNPCSEGHSYQWHFDPGKVLRPDRSLDCPNEIIFAARTAMWKS